MTITSITQTKSFEDRVTLHLDGEYWLTLNKNQLIDFGLYKGYEIDDELKLKLEQASQINKVLDKAIGYLTIRPRSVREIRDYLKKKEVDSVLIEQTINILINKKFLSDLEFAKWYAKARFSQKKYGINKIKADLAQKGVSKDIVREALGETDQDDNFENLIELAKKFIPKIKAKDQVELRQKLIQRLASRGFLFEEITKALKELNQSKED